MGFILASGDFSIVFFSWISALALTALCLIRERGRFEVKKPLAQSLSLASIILSVLAAALLAVDLESLTAFLGALTFSGPAIGCYFLAASPTSDARLLLCVVAIPFFIFVFIASVGFGIFFVAPAYVLVLAALTSEVRNEARMSSV